MKQLSLHADSFVLKKRRIRIYRIQQRGTGTVLWTSPKQALRYLNDIQRQRLQAKDKGR